MEKRMRCGCMSEGIYIEMEKGRFIGQESEKESCGHPKKEKER